MGAAGKHPRYVPPVNGYPTVVSLRVVRPVTCSVDPRVKALVLTAVPGIVRIDQETTNPPPTGNSRWGGGFLLRQEAVDERFLPGDFELADFDRTDLSAAITRAASSLRANVPSSLKWMPSG